MTMKMIHMDSEIDWFEVELEEDQDFDYPFLPCVDNIWTE